MNNNLSKARSATAFYRGLSEAAQAGVDLGYPVLWLMCTLGAVFVLVTWVLVSIQGIELQLRNNKAN